MRAYLSFFWMSLLVCGCGGPVSEPQARAIATTRFMKYCSSYTLSAADYDGPASISVGGAAYAYEWRKKEKKTDGVVMAVTIDGITEVALLTK